MATKTPTPDVQGDETTDQTVTLSMSDLSAFVQQRVNEALAARDAEHAQVLMDMRKLIPDHTVPAHAGGPGITRLQSWSLVQQEASARGDLAALETGAD